MAISLSRRFYLESRRSHILSGEHYLWISLCFAILTWTKWGKIPLAWNVTHPHQGGPLRGAMSKTWWGGQKRIQQWSTQTTFSSANETGVCADGRVLALGIQAHMYVKPHGDTADCWEEPDLGTGTGSLVGVSESEVMAKIWHMEALWRWSFRHRNKREPCLPIRTGAQDLNPNNSRDDIWV